MFTGPNIVTDGLVLALDAGNDKSYPGSGTAYSDLTESSYLGSLNNNPSFNSSGYFQFDASDDFIEFNNSDKINFTNSMSHEVWFLRTSNSTSNLRLTSKGAGGSGTDQQGFSFFGSNTSLSWAVNVGGVRDIISTSILVGKWYQVVGTADFENSIIKIYLNGVEKSNKILTNTTTMVSNINFFIGSYYSPTLRLVWSGNIGPVKLYNKALTSEEVLQNYNATKGRFGL